MFIQSHPLSLWRRCAGACFLLITLALTTILLGLDSLGEAVNFPFKLFLIGPGLAVIFLFCELFFKKQRRLKHQALMFGAFVAFPFVVFSFSPLFVLMVASVLMLWVKIVLFLIVLLVSLYWTRLKVRASEQIIIRYKYLAKELKPLPDGSYFIDGDKAKRIEKLKERAWSGPRIKTRWLMPILIPMMTVGPSLHRVVAASGGHLAVFTLLSALATPLAIYAIGEISGGFYIWVLSVHRFETNHDTKVYLPTVCPRTVRN